GTLQGKDLVSLKRGWELHRDLRGRGWFWCAVHHLTARRSLFAAYADLRLGHDIGDRDDAHFVNGFQRWPSLTPPQGRALSVQVGWAQRGQSVLSTGPLTGVDARARRILRETGRLV